MVKLKEFHLGARRLSWPINELMFVKQVNGMLCSPKFIPTQNSSDGVNIQLLKVGSWVIHQQCSKMGLLRHFLQDRAGRNIAF